MSIRKEVLENLFRKPSTQKYPYEEVKLQERFRGKIAFDKSKCIGCGLCRMYCPSECIKLTWKKKKMIANKVEYQKIIHPIDEINIGKCIRCGLCIDVCPVKCIWFTHEFELANRDKKKLISESV